VILLDLDMPDLAGLEAMQQLRDMVPGVPIIALTSLDGYAPVGAARAAGARDVVSKASLTTDLLPAIQRATAPRHACTRRKLAPWPAESP
jgi:CheY-like chemotaxis protein